MYIYIVSGGNVGVCFSIHKIHVTCIYYDEENVA